MFVGTRIGYLGFGAGWRRYVVPGTSSSPPIRVLSCDKNGLIRVRGFSVISLAHRDAPHDHHILRRVAASHRLRRHFLSRSVPRCIQHGVDTLTSESFSSRAEKKHASQHIGLFVPREARFTRVVSSYLEGNWRRFEQDYSQHKMTTGALNEAVMLCGYSGPTSPSNAVECISCLAESLKSSR